MGKRKLFTGIEVKEDPLNKGNTSLTIHFGEDRYFGIAFKKNCPAGEFIETLRTGLICIDRSLRVDNTITRFKGK